MYFYQRVTRGGQARCDLGFLRGWAGIKKREKGQLEVRFSDYNFLHGYDF